MATDTKTPITSVQDFIFNTPLYAECTLPSSKSLEISRAIDGHCYECGRDSTFIRASYSSSDGIIQHHCSRNNNHSIWVYFRFDGFNFIKIGQTPSYADLTKVEILKYKKVLDKEDLIEFRRAVGLAANGIGVGAFVYLRRIFERLIDKRYTENKSDKGWSDTEFYQKRMAEKITFLKDYLPDFMAENPRLYSVISKGIHQLSEEECLSLFNIVKQSIIFILEEDSIKRERAETRKRVEEELKSFSGLIGNTDNIS